MTLATPIKDSVSRLVDSFLQAQITPQLQKKLTAILKAGYATTADVTIQERFAGFEEKCRVLNNNELADALVHSYEKLGGWRSRAKFDMIALLLHLADNPVEKTRLDDLQDFVPKPVSGDLSWKDLLHDDPFDNADGRWNTINYAASSSEESEWSLEESEPEQVEEQLSISDDVDNYLHTSLLDVEDDDSQYESIVSARKAYEMQFSLTSEIRLTETQALRETLFMLQGLPSYLYTTEASNVKLVVDPTIDDLSKDMTRSILQSFSYIGSSLTQTRKAITNKLDQPIQQTFQSCLAEYLRQFELYISGIEQDLVSGLGIPWTLMSVCTATDAAFDTLGMLSSVLVFVNSSTNQLLDTLFDLVSEQQGLGHPVRYENISKIFFACFNTFLHPLTNWIEHGELDNQADAFFIKRNSQASADNNMWRGQFELMRNEEGAIAAPMFLMPITQKIFVAGKNIKFLQALGATPFDTRVGTTSSPFVFEQNPDSLEPFEDSFSLALHDWIENRTLASNRQVLDTFKQCSHLNRSLLVVEHLWLSKDGATFQELTDSVCQRIKQHVRWADRFVLTDLWQEHFKNVLVNEAKGVSVQITQASHESTTRFMHELARLKVDCNFSWATSIVIQPRHIKIFQRISIMLMQMRYAGQLLAQRTMQHTRYTQANPRYDLALSLRQRLGWFVTTVQSYLMIAVVEPTMRVLRANISRATDLDQLIDTFSEAATQLETCCLLADAQKKTLQTLVSILDLTVLFNKLCTTPDVNVERSQCTVHDSSDTDDSDNEMERPSTGSISQSQFHETIQQYSNSLNQLLSFTIAGIQEATRIDQQESLQILLESLRLGTEHT